MNRSFFLYILTRSRLFITEIFQLHQRILVAFILLFGLILSGNEQLAIKKAMVSLSRWSESSPGEWLLFGVLLVFSWVACALVKKNILGGRARYLIHSLPVSPFKERMIRSFLLGFVNLAILILMGMGWGQALSEHLAAGSLAASGLTFLTLYLLILGFQLSFIEKSWGNFGLFPVSMLLILGLKGSSFILPLCALAGIQCFLFLRKSEAMGRRLGSWTLFRRDVKPIRGPSKIPANFIVPYSYLTRKPAVLIQIGILTLILNAGLWLILRESIPPTQKIYVYTLVTGFLAMICGPLFRSFHQARSELQAWLTSLPVLEKDWIRMESQLVRLVYACAVLPISLFLWAIHAIPFALLFIMLPIHFLSLPVIRRFALLARSELGVFCMIGACFWFLFLGFCMDHGWTGG